MTTPASSLLNNADFVQSCEQFIQTRHSIHAHPELGSEVPNTAQLVAKLLQEWGYETHTQVGGHGVVGVLKHGSAEHSIGIRADMDALPIQENTGLPYASTIDGRMHACGHDGHTAILLAAAHYLAQHKPFDGTVNLIFQPDEEGLSGAQAMIDDGLFERFPCDAIFALHNMPGKEVGQADVRSGIFSASSDKVTIRLTGKGGHAALPHLSADVTIAIGHIILGLQSIVSRNISPSDQSIVSIGQIQAGTTPNVIPNDAMMTLSVRNFSQQNQDLIEQRIRDIVAGQCRAFGIQGEVEYRVRFRRFSTLRQRRAGRARPYKPCWGKRMWLGKKLSRSPAVKILLDAPTATRVLFHIGERFGRMARLFGAQPGIRLQ